MKAFSNCPFRGALAAILLGGVCAAARAAEVSAARPVRVVATIFPAWDWAREIAAGAENADLTLLLDDGVDLHSYQPSAADLKAVAECDLFIHVGGESDDWVAPALAAAPNPRRRVLNLLEALGDAAKAEETVDGMEPEHHGDGEEDDDEDEEEEELDEHVWLSLRHAQTLSWAIAEALSELDPAEADAFRANAAAYREKLAALDAAYAAAVAAAPRRTLVVADRFPLRYLADDYGLDYFAAFTGCSAETEASFQTVLFLARKADELDAKALLVLEGARHRIAETVRAATQAKNQAIVVFDSLQSVTAARAAAGETYLGAMERNLGALAEGLR